QVPMPISEVLVRGGAGVANDRIVTPLGVATQITEVQAQMLEANPVFQLHKTNGYVQISEEEISIEKAVADMTGPDVSAPLVENDLKAEDVPDASTSKKKK